MVVDVWFVVASSASLALRLWSPGKHHVFPNRAHVAGFHNMLEGFEGMEGIVSPETTQASLSISDYP